MEEEKPIVDTFGHHGQLGHRFLNFRIEILSGLKTNIYKGLKMPEKGVKNCQELYDEKLNSFQYGRRTLYKRRTSGGIEKYDESPKG
jgi:hypothetical protein